MEGTTDTGCDFTGAFSYTGRTPFVHLKEFDHQHGISQRMAKNQNFDIRGLPENGAEEALIAMYGVAAYVFALPFPIDRAD